MKSRADLYFFPDDGCEEAPHCLTCPLPRCKYDEPWIGRGLNPEVQRRNEAMRVDRAAGMTVKEISKRYGVSKTTVTKATSRRQVEGKS